MSLNLTALKPVSGAKPLQKEEAAIDVNKTTKNKTGQRGRPAGAVKAADKTMIGFRVTKTQAKEIKQLALDLDTSVNDLLLRALESYKKGLRVR